MEAFAASSTETEKFRDPSSQAVTIPAFVPATGAIEAGASVELSRCSQR
jgi:hypothetical protein